MTRMLIIGPPGAGKGTQAVRIAQRQDIPTISTGDIFRENIKNGTELGREAQSYTDAGNLVPDSVTNRMVRDRLSWKDCVDGFLLDGYPRTRAQAEELDRILAAADVELDVVLQLTADKDELVSRLLKRAQEQGRADDTEDVIRHRLDVYERETAPVIGLYAERGIVTEVDGIGAIDDVTERITAALA